MQPEAQGTEIYSTVYTVYMMNISRSALHEHVEFMRTAYDENQEEVWLRCVDYTPSMTLHGSDLFTMSVYLNTALHILTMQHIKGPAQWSFVWVSICHHLQHNSQHCAGGAQISV